MQVLPRLRQSLHACAEELKTHRTFRRLHSQQLWVPFRSFLRTAPGLSLWRITSSMTYNTPSLTNMMSISIERPSIDLGNHFKAEAMYEQAINLPELS